MGHKVNPVGIRLGVFRKSNSYWFPKRDKFSVLFRNDVYIRDCVYKTFGDSALISNIYIYRTVNNISIVIRTAKPGVVIGKKGSEIDKLRMYFSNYYQCWQFNLWGSQLYLH